MRGKRMWHTLRLFMILEPGKRTEYLRKNHVFASIGERCSIENRTVPLYAKLIKIGNNVQLASRVSFVTHDVSYLVLNRMGLKDRKGGAFRERIGCIEIGDNVFVGANTTILYDVRIGNNVIIGAGSIVNRDIPDNSVAVGIPARVVDTFDNFVKKRRNDRAYPESMRASHQEVTDEFAKWLWDDFISFREEK